MKTENKKTIVFTYRYLWKTADENKTSVRILTGVEEEHSEFIKWLVECEECKSAVRVYVGEFDCALLDNFETIKKEIKKENEEV